MAPLLEVADSPETPEPPEELASDEPTAGLPSVQLARPSERSWFPASMK